MTDLILVVVQIDIEDDDVKSPCDQTTWRMIDEIEIDCNWIDLDGG